MNPILILQKNQSLEKTHMMGFFSKKEGAGFFEWYHWTADKELEMLVFRISRKPKFLEGHIERIYHCLYRKLNDQLFGALIDLIIILDGCGQGLANRMLLKSKLSLSVDRYQALVNLLVQKQKHNSMVSSRYSVFTKGLIAGNIMIDIS